MTAETSSRIAAARPADHDAGSFGPFGSGWAAAEAVEAALQPTPLDAQPSAYVQTAWANRRHGVTPSARVAAAVAGGVLRVRVQWAASSPRPAITDNNVFADACALLFPLDGKQAELMTMGDADHPVRAWHWRAGTPDPFVLTATGLGTTSRQAMPHGVTVEAEWHAGEWAVVFSGALEAAGASSVPMGVAIWQGAAEERGGLAAHTPAWITLELPR